MKVTINIPNDTLFSVLDTASIQYWGDYKVGWMKDAPGETKIARYEAAYNELLEGKRTITVLEHEGHDATGHADKRRNVPHTLTDVGIQKAIDIIANKWPWHLKTILDGGDSESGDVLIQVALFGDIIYG